MASASRRGRNTGNKRKEPERPRGFYSQRFLSKQHEEHFATWDKQLIVFTDPTLSLKVVDQMLKLGWEGDGLKHLIK